MDDLISRKAAIEIASGFCHPANIAKELEKLPSAQPEQSNASEFWRKRADYYSDLCMRLIAEMGKGVKIDSVKISESGIEFFKEQPSAQPDFSCDGCKTPKHICGICMRNYPNITDHYCTGEWEGRRKE